MQADASADRVHTSSLGLLDPQIDLSTIIVNWNTSALLRASLDSFYAGVGDLTVEAIVVDNGSRDESLALISRDFPWVRLIALDKNLGFARANNVGLAAAHGRYILLLNSDTVVLPNALPRLVAYLDQDATAGAIGPRLLNEDGSLQSSARDFPRLWSDLIAILEVERWPLIGLQVMRRQQHTSLYWSDHRQTRPVDWVSGACLMLRRCTLEEVGGLDPSYFFFGEELDLCSRLRQHGWSVVFVAEAEIVHLGGQSAARIPATRLFWHFRSLLQFYQRRRTRSNVVVLRIAIAASALLHMAALLVRHRDNPDARRLLSAYMNVIGLTLWKKVP